MIRRRNTITRLWMVVLSNLVLLGLLAACGGSAATNPEGAGVVGPGASEIAQEDPAAGEEATVAVEGPTAVTNKPTGVPEVACQAGQKELVWMVRNGPVENQWEANVVRPAFQKAHPEI